MILTQDDGTAYPFDLTGLSKEDQVRAAAQFESIIKAGGDYSQAVTTAKRFIDATLNPPDANAPKNTGEPAEEESTHNPRKPMNLRTLSLTIGITAALGLAAVAYDAFFPKNAKPAPVNPLVEIAHVRTQAALELQAANETLKSAARAQAQAKARYDAAWKREACLIDGNCPKK